MIRRAAIIGGGISGLSAAFFLQEKYPEAHLDIYEASQTLGGVIQTEKVAGCILEGGPDSFLTAKKSAFRLCQLLGLESELIPSNDQSRKTFIYHEGQLRELPDGFFLMAPTRLVPLIKTDLLTWVGKLDALNDLFSYPEQADCTVADFVEKRFGQEVLRKIVEPMIGGIYGGDPERLSLQSALPQIWELQKKGSIIAQLLGRDKHKFSGESLFTTLANGMSSLIERLQSRIRADWKLLTAVEFINNRNGRWEFHGEIYNAVVIASSVLPSISVPEFEEIRSIWNSIRRNSAVVVILGFHGMQRSGFGWLVPSNQRRSILACTYVSNKFPGRSPKELFLVRTFIGGPNASKWIDRSNSEIQIEVLSELKRIAQITEEPAFCKIFRWKDAMPEYSVGHAAKIVRLNELIRSNRGIAMTGNLFSGVGIPDCIRHAEETISTL
jgi:protoporphyrinogen/coproporphyrinogen III oxidase